MKRKITFVLMAMASALMSLTYANDGFESLVFKSATGESYSVKTEGLEIYFNDGKLTFSNDNLVIPVASLVSMEFSDNSGVERILSDATGPVTVLSVDGIRIGEFSSLQEAYGGLKPGVYVVRHSNGKNFKISVGQ